MITAAIVGNPKPASRTLHAARLVIESLTGDQPDVTVDLVEYGPALLGYGDRHVNEVISTLQGCDLAVFASPTYKGTYAGLLKLFFDQVPADALTGLTSIPLMLGAGLSHALAPEVHLKPVLTELGASCPTKALYLLESQYQDPDALGPWLTHARRCLYQMNLGS